ncbi:hypothetical protein ONS95_004113 [Cadophora gregata]|uniref:uncharacterized protein n=1 Tax=Cadophora gregata TaxID=51156 RepID=UPI0026DA880B|nr:uncharacterized protein ONS95_004113 [Cadophora gregata]KAK0105527.1 hypothetical protein ONS96_004913 [Cadophora gregata f. sp. sojae]KAK0105581.1 hypothetical protein ONS95_004113 [Cadophora gregata]
MVLIPDIFESFMSREPTPNIHYDEAGEESLLWTIKTCRYNKSEADRMRRGDFAYFAAVTVPDVDKEGLKVVTDWLNWVFVFDDQLDDGPLGVLEHDARKYIDCTLAMLEDVNVNREDVQPIQWVLRDIWNGVQMVRAALSTDFMAYRLRILSAALVMIELLMYSQLLTSKGVKRRWLKHMKEYLRALRSSIGFAPSIALDDTISGYFEY